MNNNKLQKEYTRVKQEFDRLFNLYFSSEESSKPTIEEIKDQFTLLKSLNKQLYYHGCTDKVDNANK
jgi:hypothetical protein